MRPQLSHAHVGINRASTSRYVVMDDMYHSLQPTRDHLISIGHIRSIIPNNESHQPNPITPLQRLQWKPFEAPKEMVIEKYGEWSQWRSDSTTYEFASLLISIPLTNYKINKALYKPYGNSISKRLWSSQRSFFPKDGLLQISFHELLTRWLQTDTKVHGCLYAPYSLQCNTPTQSFYPATRSKQDKH